MTKETLNESILNSKITLKEFLSVAIILISIVLAFGANRSAIQINAERNGVTRDMIVEARLENKEKYDDLIQALNKIQDSLLKTNVLLNQIALEHENRLTTVETKLNKE